MAKRLRRAAAASTSAVALAAAALAVSGGAPGHLSAHGTLGEPGVCKDCQPPLLIHDGAVMGTAAAPGSVTVTPIYWTPNGYDYNGDANFQTLVNQYINDLAASTATDTNSVRVTSEYTNAAGTPMNYSITAGTPITVTDAFPNGGCTPDAGYTVCVTGAQLKAELTTVLTNNNLPADLAHFYPVFFPKGVETQDDSDGSKSCGSYLGYHGAFAGAGGTIVFGNEPFLGSADCGFTGQSPNNDPAADAVISVFNHELSEAMTDPTSGRGNDGWTDTKGNEIGDECNFDFGTPLGGTDGAMYNQTIGGHNYYTQREFSNASYAANGVGNGCLQTAYTPTALSVREHLAAHTAAATADNPTSISVDASPEQLPADGRTTSTVTLTAVDSNGDPVAGDHILFFTHEDPGMLGACGSLSGASPTASPYYSGVKDVTDANGQVQVTYTASTVSDACYVFATDTEAGRTDGVIVYQGGDARQAPRVQQTLPSSLHTGHVAYFRVLAVNSSNGDIQDARFDVFLTGDDLGSLGVDASQVHLYYSDISTGGRYVPVTVDGTTADDGEIDAFVPPDSAANLPARSYRSVNFELVVDSSAPTSAQTGAPLRIETDLDNYDAADGSQSNLDYAGPGNVTVLR